MIDTLCMANGWWDMTRRLWVEGFMIPSRLDIDALQQRRLDTWWAADS
jgi:hypothetical protein